jgi:hypothetical protein
MTEHSEQSWWETIEAEGEHLLKKVDDVIAEGNVRRIVIAHDGRPPP